MPLVRTRPSPRRAARRYRHAIADVIYTAMTGSHQGCTKDLNKGDGNEEAEKSQQEDFN